MKGASNKSSGIPSGFVDALVTYADAVGSDNDLQTELLTLFAQIQNQKGKEVIASTINGKYFGFEVTMTVEEKFTAFAQAIRRFNGDATVCTYPDFSGLVR